MAFKNENVNWSKYLGNYLFKLDNTMFQKVCLVLNKESDFMCYFPKHNYH